MKAPFLMSTRYYYKSWTWIKRGLEFLLAGLLLFCVSLVETDSEYAWIRYALFAILSVYIFVRPVDELAISRETLFYIRKSVIRYFTKVEEFDLSQIKSIGCGGLYDTDTELLGRARPTNNRLELFLKTILPKALDVKIYKRELRWIVKNTLRLINQHGA
jgi:hypothetical protein